MDYITITYTLYLLISIAMTIWVARTLFKHGAPFLIETFAGDQTMANSVNRLLVVGFYLINLGFVSLFLRLEVPPVAIAGIFESLAGKLGVVLLVLGAMHFANLGIFMKIRDGNRKDHTLPPLERTPLSDNDRPL